MIVTKETVATKRDMPRWVVIVGVIGAILSALAGNYAGQKSKEPELNALRARQQVLAAQVQDEPIVYEGQPYEVGQHEVDGDAAEARFPRDQVTWWVDPAGSSQVRPAVTHEQVRAAFRAAWANWAERLQIEPVEVMDEGQAMVRHRFGYIDGNSRTLAYSTLTDGSDRPQEQKYDTGEVWTLGPPAPGQIALVVVATHEIGHAMGLGHDVATADAIMRPTYSSTITKPTDRDIGRMVQLGYKQRTLPVPVPPAPGVIGVTATIRTDDVLAELKRLGYQVVPPAGQGIRK